MVANRAYTQWMVVAPIIKVSTYCNKSKWCSSEFKACIGWLICFKSLFWQQDKLKELEDGFFDVQAEQEAIALNTSSLEEASEFLSDECKYSFSLPYG